MSEYHISLDDVKGVFKALSTEQMQSIFETRTLHFLNQLHEQYGTIFHLYCTYCDGKYSLSNLSDKYREEFLSCSNWLKFGFHCFDENTPLHTFSYNVFCEAYDHFTYSLKKVTGQAGDINALRLHKFDGTVDELKFLHTKGIDYFLAADDIRPNYYLSDQENSILNSRGLYNDSVNSLNFVRSCVRLEHASEDALYLEFLNAEEQKLPIIPIFTHEWQMDSPTIRNLLDFCCKEATS